MGSYTSFSINEYEFYSDKNSYSNYIMAIFTEEMRKIIDDEENERKSTIYTLNSRDFARRLDLMGYTLEKAKLDFANCFNEEDYFEYFEGEKPSGVDYNLFCTIIKYVLDNKIYYWDFDKIGYLPMDDIDYSELIKYMFDTILDFEGWILGFPVSNPLYLFRIAIDVSGYQGEVTYDVSDIINAGYYNENHRFAEEAKRSFEHDHNTFGSTIIITEGKMDRFILKSALSFLYPNLVDLYTFFDYQSAKAPGSTNEVVKIVKSFVASRILNKVIAIFDNDTAGHQAIMELKSIELPENIKIGTYPDILVCNDYPTIGPQGVQRMNINGFAGSIELYLGNEILKENDEYTPIQWTGYIEKMEQYQGKIMGKSNVYKKFVKKYNESPDEIEWGNLNKVLEMIFSAFDIQ